MRSGYKNKVQADPAQSFTPAGTGLLHRKCTLCNTPGLVGDLKRDNEGLTLQRSPTNHDKPATVPPIVHEWLHSPCQPLNPDMRAFIEPRFGHDFSRVSILRDAHAMIQAKLTINQPNDRYEQEADRVADEVMRMPEPEVQRQQEEEKEKELLQTKPFVEQISPSVQRQVDEKERQRREEEILRQLEKLHRREEIEQVHEELFGQMSIQHSQAGKQGEGKFEKKNVLDAATYGNMELVSQIQGLKGKGQPLPDSLRAFFEPRFGYDFSEVRIHTDRQAAELAQAVNAKAFTFGRDIVFNTKQYNPGMFRADEYAPGITHNDFLLAHELTHVVQQNHFQSPERNSAKRSTPIQVTNKLSHSVITREFGRVYQIAEDVSFRFDPDTGIVEFTGEGTHDFLRAQLGRIGQNFHITELNRNILFQIQMIIGWPLRGEPENIQLPSTYRSLLYNVPIIRQPAPWGCWAASFSMIYAWRYPDEYPIPDLADPEEVNDFIRFILRPYGEHWVDSFDQEIGLNDTNVSSFLNDTGLSGEIVANSRNPEQWFRILSTYGPLMVGIAGHMLVVVGIAGNGVPEDTVFFINNPSFGGVETTEPFNEFIDRFEALEAAGHEGVHIFHWP
jgi:hypothetical protein